MNLETRIDKRLWNAIRSSYENQNFTGSIQDSIYFLSELIQERSGLKEDGTILVGHAFGGRSPLLKVNKLKTTSEKDVQKGIEQLLRGLYQAVRNPRSHEKHLDSEEDAVAIILFINYLVKFIDESKTPFLEQTFILSVIDPGFVPKNRYAELLVNKIPEKKRMDIFYGVFQKLSEGDGNKLQYFFNALFNKLTQDEKQETYREISEFLQNANEIKSIRKVIESFATIWPELEETARLRTENMLIESIKDGIWHSLKNKYIGGAFGSWAIYIKQHFILKEDLLHVLLNKLESSDRGEQDYVFKYFADAFDKLTDSLPSRLKRIIINGLERGDIRFKEMVDNDLIWEWLTSFEQDLKTFEEQPLPFDPEYDDVPF